MAFDRTEALKEVQKANPKWPLRLAKYAVEIMPTSYSYAYPQGSQQEAYAIADHKYRWTLWAISINILPDDTPLPPAPQGKVDMYSNRVERPVAQRSAVSRGALVQPVEFVPPPSLSVVMRNGVWPPKKDSNAEKIWQAAEQLRAANGRVPAQDELMQAVSEQGLAGEVTGEYPKWLKYIA